MHRIGILSILASLALPALAEPAPEALLQTAFTRIDAGEIDFRPLRFRYEAHTWVRDGDDHLEREELETGLITVWTPDSTQSETLETKILFSEEEREDPAEDEARGRDESDGPPEDAEESGKLPDFDAEFRSLHGFRFQEWTEREGRRAARYELHPAEKKKGRWKGSVWLAAEDGALLAAELEPAKRPFGLKGMSLKADYRDFEGRDVAEHLEMFVEVKIPIIVHKRIRMDMDFREFELLDE